MRHPEKKILLLTANFPYYPGEQFLEEEIKYWATNFPDRVIILPGNISDVSRKISGNIAVDNSLAIKENVVYRRLFYLYVLFSPVFRKEVKYVFRKYRLANPRCFIIALRTSYGVYTLQRKLKRYLKLHQEKYIVYTYWFDTAAYAAALLKTKGMVDRVISRAHGFDLYEWIRPYGYMPLKRQFGSLVDEVLAISAEGKAYLEQTYDTLRNKVRVARLGVRLTDKINPPNTTGRLIIVSTSFCTRNKRVDKIIESLAILTDRKPLLNVTWHHIGNGPEWESLRQMASSLFKDSRVIYNFHGELTNREVHHFFADNPVDVFINVSDSEGIPVSIMEAMSFTIPAVAPAVGGIPELVNQENGILLKAMPDVQEIAEALSDTAHFRRHEVRNNAKKQIESFFNAEKNYKAMIDYFLGFDKN